MVIDTTVTALLAILLGSIIAIAGYHLLKGLVSLLGALIFGGAAFTLGLWVGGFVAGILGLIIAIAFGLIGVVIGAILAVALATIVLAVGFGVLSFIAGVSLGERLDLPGIGPVLLGAVLAVIGAFLFLMLAKTLIRAATSILGGFMVASGSFHLMDRFTPLQDMTAFIVCMGAFAVVSAVGYVVQSGAERRDRNKPASGKDKAPRRKR